MSYLEALRKIFVVEDMPAWNPNLRSKTAIRTADTRYFVDPSIATAALGMGPADLVNDLNTMGFFFETLCVRDLRVFAEALNRAVRVNRNKTRWAIPDRRRRGDTQRTGRPNRYLPHESPGIQNDFDSHGGICLPPSGRRDICRACRLPETVSANPARFSASGGKRPCRKTNKGKG